MKEFTSTEHAIRYSEQHNDIALLISDNFNVVIADAEALGYEVNYTLLDKDLYDNRDTYDVWGMENPESDDQDWRLTVKIELQD